MTDQPRRLTEKVLAWMETDAHRHLSPSQAGDQQRLIDEIRRLRALARTVVDYSLKVRGGFPGRCPVCDCYLTKAMRHGTSCPWPELEEEAKR